MSYLYSPLMGVKEVAEGGYESPNEAKAYFYVTRLEHLDRIRKEKEDSLLQLKQDVHLLDEEYGYLREHFPELFL